MNINMISWFEVPVVDMDRAKKFYETVFDITINVNDFAGTLMGEFPSAEDAATLGITGCLILHKEYIPSATHGTLVYFNSQTGDINDELKRVETAGGKILKPKTLITDEIGYMAVILDSEGNRIALYNK